LFPVFLVLFSQEEAPLFVIIFSPPFIIYRSWLGQRSLDVSTCKFAHSDDVTVTKACMEDNFSWRESVYKSCWFQLNFLHFYHGLHTVIDTTPTSQVAVCLLLTVCGRSKSLFEVFDIFLRHLVSLIK
jgi:hypothetical protein